MKDLKFFKIYFILYYLLDFASERRLAQTSPLSFLKDTRLGIDSAYWLRKLLQTCAKEPAIAALGGIPIGLKNAIEEELQQFK